MTHPVFELLLDAAIEDAALGGVEGVQKLLSGASGRRLSRSELARARQRADLIGRMGEELVNRYFAAQQRDGRIERFDWISDTNAVSPFDFLVTTGGEQKIEVKSTCGTFAQVIHISMAELLEMRADPAYFLYRLSGLDDSSAKLRIAAGLQAFAASVLRQLEGLPKGVRADSVSVRPETLSFGDEHTVEFPQSGDDESE